MTSLVAVLALFIVVVLVAWLTVRLVVDQWGAISSMLADGQATLEEAASDQGVDPTTAASVGETSASSRRRSRGCSSTASSGSFP